DTVDSVTSYALPANVENLRLTGIEDIDGTGNELDNVLTGNSGINTLIGGPGNDTYYVQNVGDVVIENPGEGKDVVFAKVSWTLPGNVENLSFDASGLGDSEVLGENSVANLTSAPSGLGDSVATDNSVAPATSLQLTGFTISSVIISQPTFPFV